MGRLDYKSGPKDGLANGVPGILAGGSGSSDIPFGNPLPVANPEAGHGIGNFTLLGVPFLGNGNPSVSEGRAKAVGPVIVSEENP